MVKLKVTTVGSSAGVVLPKEVLARLKVAKGDTIFSPNLRTPIGLHRTMWSLKSTWCWLAV